MVVVGSNSAPLPEIKPTRQWDAWKREEEESFFGALEQVGKNFEKITSRVQSKTKEQVRHYYYRVIKRMNRILAPALVLNAKNSTFANSAMLEWWSLLEKHNCSASKLRLKSTRFKSFVTALENQLSKDHKMVETEQPTTSAATSTHAAHSETAAICSTGLPDLVSSGSEGPGRRTAVKRKAPASKGPRKSLSEREARPPRPRKKAASVGVSLVAETAEQVERASETEVMPSASAASELRSVAAIGGPLNLNLKIGQIPPGPSAAFAECGLSDKLSKELPTGPQVSILGLGGVPVSSSGFMSAVVSPSPMACTSVPAAAVAPNGVLPNVYEGGPGGHRIIPELCAQVKAKSLALDSTRCNNCSALKCGVREESMTGAKLKLRLFPFSECIGEALEQDGHNPHLELTFRPEKSISCVLNHLVQKWGRSAVALGDLRLFPFKTDRWSDLSACKSWSFQDLNVSAADVLAAVGNPPVFRLRYAWLSSHVLESSPAVLQQQPQGPALYKSRLVPGLKRKSIGKENVPPQASTSRGVCIGSSTVMSTEVPQLAAKQFLPPFCAGWNVQVAVRPDGSGGDQSFVLPAGMEFEHPAVRKSPCSDRIRPADVTLGSCFDKDVVPPVLDPVPFADNGAGGGNVYLSKFEALENANQTSGYAWFDESNHGFNGQDLWREMEGADSFTNMSMTELLGESARAVVPSALQVDGGGPVPFSPVDGGAPPQSSCFTQVQSLDSFDIAIASLPPLVRHSEAFFGGEDTCDAFSFQRVDIRNAEVGISIGDELCGNSLDAAIMAREREGNLLSAAFDTGEQPRHSPSEDLSFDGEVSIGLGGLIEALAQRTSQDEFTAFGPSNGAGLRDFDKETGQGGGFSGQAREWNAKLRKDLPRTDGTGIGISGGTFRQLARMEELSCGSTELIGLLERLRR